MNPRDKTSQKKPPPRPAPPKSALVRFSGGPVHGKLLWVDVARASLDIHVNDAETGTTRTVTYQRENTMFVFAGESETTSAIPETTTGSETK